MDDVRVTESCAQCSAPLADDQRYCLQCGEPRPHLNAPQYIESTTDNSPTVVTGPSPNPSSAPRLPSTAGSGRNNSLALIAGVGVLLLAMGVGVLIGRAGVGSAKAPPAQVISLGASGATSGSSTTGNAPIPPAASTAPEPSSSTAKKQKEAKAKEPSGTGSSITKPAPPSAAAKLHSGGSKESYEQKSKNLPNVISTG